MFSILFLTNGPELIYFFYLYIILYILNSLLILAIYLSIMLKNKQFFVINLTSIYDVSDMYKINPFLAFILVTSLLSLSGIPPFSAFSLNFIYLFNF